jgi:hypothetical protein
VNHFLIAQVGEISKNLDFLGIDESVPEDNFMELFFSAVGDRNNFKNNHSHCRAEKFLLIS